MSEPRHVPVVLLGPGKVGRAFVAQLVAARASHAERLGLRLAVVAIADRGGAVVADKASGGEIGDEFGDIPLRGLIEHKAGGGSIEAMAGAVATADLDLDCLAAGIHVDRDAAPIIVDCSADDTTDVLLAARERGWRIVLANKVPLTGAWEAFERLTRSGRGARWETTVAAALPVIAALQTLVDRGDRVHRITGTLSGTLGFIARRLSDDALLSAAVAEADALGYLEPDPRTDLSGLDAARKALILARMLGRRMELADIAVDGLYPRAWDALDRAAFMARLPEIDAAWSARAGEAGRRGRTLRFIATIDADGARLGMTDVDPADRAARVDATDSIVIFETDCFGSNPLVVSGRGGGPAVTASGVLGDVVSLAREEGGRA